MPDDGAITHMEALSLIDARLGEKVYYGVWVTRTDGRGDAYPAPVIQLVGELSNPLAPKPPRLEPDIGFYRIGGDSGNQGWFGPMTGTVHLRDEGIDFRIADGVTIRIAWHGSTEVGDGTRPGRTP